MIDKEMSLKELESYRGSNPIPNDFHDFWKERVAECQTTLLEYEILESDIKGFDCCKFQNLWFRGFHGEKMYAKYARPNTTEKVPLVVQFHGYPGASRSWFEQASFVGMGYAVIAMDCPGQGGLSEDNGMYQGSTISGLMVRGLDGNPKDMYYVRVYQNICILMRIIQELSGIDHECIYVSGASQGGGLATVCAALHPKIIKKVAILYPFLSDFQRVFDLNKDEIAYDGLRYYARWFDPMGQRRQEMFEKLGYIDTHNFASLIQADVLFGCSLSDHVCPPSTQFALFNNLHTKKKKCCFYEYDHEEISAFDDCILDFFQEDKVL